MEEQLLWLAAVLDLQFFSLPKILVPICILFGVLLPLARFPSAIPGNLSIISAHSSSNSKSSNMSLMTGITWYLPLASMYYVAKNLEGNSSLNFFY